jgi:glycosyltransferase involved in cell wall biosynthesis
VRVAIASPLPPETSGIADYTADLAPRLAERCEVELFAEREGPVDPGLAAAFPCRPVAELPRALERRRYDAVVYQLGNSAGHHERIYRTLLEQPGVLVLHEYMLHHLVRELTLARGDAAGYLEEMRYAAGRTGWLAARRLLDTHYPVDTWAFPLFERAVDRSAGVLVHSEFARRRILASRPLATVGRLALPADLERLVPPGPAERARARRALGLGERDFVVACFGFVTPQKHLDPALAAFARLRAERPSARFAVVGEVSPYYDFDEALARHGGAGVVRTGRVPLGALHDWMSACDLAVNLRYPTGGETSATLVRLLALARPVVVSDAGAFGEIPDGAVAKVAPGPDEEEQLLALFRALADDAALGEALGEAGRRHAEREHAPERTVEAYLEAVTAAAGATAPAPSPPPLAPWAADDAATALLAGVGSDLADLDTGEDEAGLEAVARAMVELGLAPGGGAR